MQRANAGTRALTQRNNTQMQRANAGTCHPMSQPATPPSVAVTYEYALPATGIMDASSLYARPQKTQPTPETANETATAGPAYLRFTSITLGRQQTSQQILYW